MALGRGMGALLSESRKSKERRNQGFGESNENNVAVVPSENAVVELEIEKLHASIYQPRKDFDEEAISELAASIKEHGLLDPLIVKSSADETGCYEIICGERRYRACKVAGIAKIPCFIRNMARTDAYAIALVENMQREDLNPLEQAGALEQMLNECGMSQEELAKTLGKSRSTVTNILRLNKLIPDVKQMLSDGQIDLGHAKVLLALDGEVQKKAAEYVVKKDLSVRQTEDFVRKIKEQENDEGEDGANPVPEKSLFIKDLEAEIGQKFYGLKFRIGGNENKGKLTLSYSSAEELSKLKDLLGL